jgi:hypothetical protein
MCPRLQKTAKTPPGTAGGVRRKKRFLIYPFVGRFLIPVSSLLHSLGGPL